MLHDLLNQDRSASDLMLKKRFLLFDDILNSQLPCILEGDIEEAEKDGDCNKNGCHYAWKHDRCHLLLYRSLVFANVL